MVIEEEVRVEKKTPALSQQEISFLVGELTRVDKVWSPAERKATHRYEFSTASKAVAEANLLRAFPEVGMEEVRTRGILQRRLSDLLGEKNVGEVGQGVYGILEGDVADGLTIFIRSDMDALLTPDGRPEHMCGYNIHAAWSLLNARVLQAYREKFGLPLKRVVFIVEPNEEGAVHPEFGPDEMIDAGLIEKTGKPDLILGAHTVASQPFGTLCILEGAILASDGRFRIKIEPKKGAAGAQQAVYEFIYQVGQKFQSERADDPFNRRQIVEDITQVFPPEIVRVTDSKAVQQDRELRPNSLVSKEVFSGKLDDPQISGRLRQLVLGALKNWQEFGVDAAIKVEENGRFQIELSGSTGHVAMGGPNLKYLAAEIVHNLGEEQVGFTLDQDAEVHELTGSIRIKAADWQERAGRVETIIQKDIIQTVLAKFGESVDIQIIEPPKVTIPPTVNDTRLRNLALRAVGALITTRPEQIGLSNIRFPCHSLWRYSFAYSPRAC